MNKRNKDWMRIRRKLANIMKVGSTDEVFSREYDFISTFAVVINIIAVVMYTFDSMELKYGALLLGIEAVTVAFFAVDYVAECEKQLSKHLGRGVKIVNGKRKGRFELEFYGQDDLQTLLDALMKIQK